MLQAQVSNHQSWLGVIASSKMLPLIWIEF